MINFTNLKLKNFRSYGNTITSYNFKLGFDLISASNGAGKSSLLQSLTYCLFGKIPRLKINELINNINNSDLWVEVEFMKKNDTYRVVRGEKPKIFEIYKNDVLVDQRSTIPEYQEKLEKDILGINIQSFQMLVSIDTTLLNKSFITMPEAERRQFLETILDIRILHFINQIISSKISFISTQKTEYEYKISARKHMYDAETKKLEDIIRINEDITNNGNQILIDRQTVVDDLKNKLKLYDKAFSKIEQSKIDIIPFQDEYIKLTSIMKNLKSQYKEVEKNIMTLETIRDNAIECQSCGHINAKEDISLSKFELLENEKMFLRNELLNIKDLIDTNTEKRTKLEDIISEDARLTNNKRVVQKEYEKSLVEYEKAKQFKLLPENIDEINKLKNEIEIFEQEYLNLKSIEDTLVGFKKIVGEDGIKKKIFEKYIPLFNTYLNEFLREFDLNYTIAFNEKFEITILERREERNYYTFSASEKMRINLVIMFAFLKLVESRNGFSMNILMIDELLDNALSSEVQEMVLKFLKYKINTKNKIIVSHNSSINVELFDRVFTINKENNFSKLNIKD